MGKILKAVGLEVGPQFPAAAFDGTNLRVSEKLGASQTTTLFSTAWNGVALRYYSAARHAEALDVSLATYTGAPPALQRAEEEDHLFGLYGAALASIECMFFAAYIAGSVVKPTDFPTASKKHLREITPPNTVKHFKTSFSTDPITPNLAGIDSSGEHKSISIARNILSHRGAPPRHHNLSVHESLGGTPLPAPPTTNWELDGSLLASGRGHATEVKLADLLTAGISAIEAFTATHF
jgi:hypothetical protein